MTKDKSKPTTGKAVRDMKGTTETPPVPTGVQVHAGNIPVVTVKLLDEIREQLKRIADALEKANG